MTGTSFVPKPPLSPISNSTFLSHLFPNLPKNCCAWVCAFPGDPGVARRQWTGFGLQASAFPTIDLVAPAGTKLNTFATFGAFRGEVGAHGNELLFPGRRNALFAGLYALMLDDLGDGPGAKLPLAEHLDRLSPSWVLETSPGNHQAGYLLSQPIGERTLAGAFIDAMIYSGLMAESDPGMAGVTRYGRLPRGWNGKAKYGPDGFHHRLVHWAPESRYTPRQIAQAFGIDWADVEKSVAGATPGRGAAAVDDVDPGERAWMDLFAAAVGRFEGPRDKGSAGVWYDCTCPWVHEHTDEIDNGSAYCVGGGFECHHGHCRDRTWQDVRQWLLRHPDSEISGAAIDLVGQEAFGLELVEAPPREAFGESVPTFLQARAITSRLDRDSTPAAIDDALRKIAVWAVDGQLTQVETGTLKQDVVDATRLNKGDVTQAFKVASAAYRRQRNAEANRKALASEPEPGPGAQTEARTRVRPPIPLIAPGAFPMKVGDSDMPALVSGNVEHILRTAGVSVAYNQMRQCKEYEGAFRGWSLDWAGSWLRDACTLNGLLGANEVVLKRMTDKLAEEHAYHPFVNWLDTLQWDGVSRLQDLFATIRVAPDKTRLRDLILRRWLCSAIAAARHLHAEEPGLQPRGLVVFTGAQRKGKSTWFARLFRGLFPGSNRCFVGNAHYSGDKDSKMLNLRSLVVEWGELETTFDKSVLGALKAFISQNMDSYRKPFAPEVSDIPRRSIYCATVNRPDFLRDSTGNSRFWAIPPLAIDLDGQRAIDMTQLWAEVDRMTAVGVAEAEAKGSYERPWLMTGEEIEYIETHNRGHRDRTDMEIWLHELFRWDDPFWKNSAGSERLNINPMRLGDVATLLGINRRGYGRNLSELKNALRELTGQINPTNTTKNINGQRLKAKFWAMPPLVDVPSDRAIDNFSNIGGVPH